MLGVLGLGHPWLGPSAQEAEAVAPDVAPLAQADRLGPSLPRRYRLRRLRLLPPPRCLRRAVTQEAQPPEQEAGLLLDHGEGQGGSVSMTQAT